MPPVGAAQAEGLELRPLADALSEPVEDLAARSGHCVQARILTRTAPQFGRLQRRRPLELAVAPVVRGQGAGRVDQLHEVRRALLPGPGVVAGEDAVVLEPERVGRVRAGVPDPDAAGAADHHRLEVLAAHDGAGPAAAGLVVLVGREAGEGNESLACRARGEDLVPRAHLLADLLLEGRQSPGPRSGPPPVGTPPGRPRRARGPGGLPCR